MQSLWPSSSNGEPHAAVTDAELADLYDYPADLARPWVQANFVSSADGAATVGDLSEGLSHPADKRVFLLGRELCDVVLVGAGTVRAEDYRGARASADRRARRARRGLSPVPPIAVVTGRCAIDPRAGLLTDTEVAPILLTTEAAPAEQRARLADAGAEVVVLGERTVSPKAALAELGVRGLLRVNCEGGPHLFAELVAADLVDQLCLTVAPLLAGAGAPRIVAGAADGPARKLQLASLLHEDGFSMFRYRRTAAP